MAFFLLVAYLAAVFIRPHEIGDPLSTSKIIRTLIILTFFAYVVFQKNKFFPPQAKAVVGMACVISISSILNGWVGGVPSLLLAFLPAALLPMIVCSGVITTQKQQSVVMLICITAAMFMVHNGHAQHMHPEGIGWTGTKSVEGTRITYMGFFNDPNDLAMFLVMTLPFLFYFRTYGSGIIKLLAPLGIVAILYGVYMSNSRGGMLGVMSLFALYFYLSRGLKTTLAVGAIAAPIALVVMSKFRKIEQGESAQGRVEAWYAGFQMFFSSPMFGVGKGNFTEYNSHTAHNSFILVLGELGFIGYTLWLSILIISILSIKRVIDWYDKQPDKKALSIEIRREVALNKALLYSFLGFITTCFFLSRSYTILFFIFCGIAIASYKRASNLIPDVAIQSYRPLIKTTFKLSIFSIFGLFVITRILL